MSDTLVIAASALSAAVDTFHHTANIAVTGNLREDYAEEFETTAELADAGDRLLEIASRFDKNTLRGLRAHLCVEEIGELCHALAKADHQQALDAIIDAVYVLIGTAVVYDLPFHIGFAEVHSSNLTKRRQETDPEGQRVRDKGPNFVAPNWNEVFRIYWSDQCTPHSITPDGKCSVCSRTREEILSAPVMPACHPL